MQITKCIDYVTFCPNHSSAKSTPRLKRKRLRSVTPSDTGGVNGASREDALLRSPLSKRKKLAADRSGYSRLKETIIADDLPEEGFGSAGKVSPKQGIEKDRVTSGSTIDEAMDEGDEEEEDDEEEDEDDFLARELEEEWG